ncbi:fibronectin type III domain-containing protein (plasmid) [Bacillus thuringiensis]|uniref:fibronectin type III domain-containing protein n=1 Tax=Bacillus thuringiensis TaxID=1428 RepID=UPI0022253923|nr:fibronectin type III domain-containing protein [Bacillus thuringiensis]UYX56201.1 fibronectin type III domain-containing protein [Bacillus thuringiensis]
MAFSIIAQGAVGNKETEASTRTVNIVKEMKKGDIVIITSMINIGGVYLSRTPDIDGFIKLSPDVPSNHNIHFYFKVIDTPVSNIRFDIKTCYQTTWMVIRGAIVESYNSSASFPLNYKFNSSDRRIAFITGEQPNSDWTLWENHCYKSAYTSGLYAYTSYYRFFFNDFVIPDHAQYNTRNGQRNYLILKEGEFIEQRIKHVGSTSWKETGSYGGVNGKCTWSVPSGVQVGDLIIVMAQSTGSIRDSSVASPPGYIKSGEVTSNGNYGSSVFYKIATESDINSKVTFYTPNTETGIGFGSINVYRNAKILSSDIVNVTGFKVSVPSQQEEVVLLAQVRGEYPAPKGGYTRIAKHGYTATTMHQYFYNATMITGSTDGEYPEYKVPWVLIGYGEANEPPTKPTSFTKQPTANSMNLSGESAQLEWTASTDLEGDAISYEVEFFNGSAWNAMASNVTTTSYSAVLPKLDTDKAQFRVRAVDSKGGQSDYTWGNVFTVATCLTLIKDGEIVKTYKGGIWKAI